MNWYLIALLGLAIFFLLGLVFFGLEEDEKTSKKSGEVYSEEELALADFLDTRQAINEDFLLAQHQLLKQLLDEQRRS